MSTKRLVGAVTALAISLLAGYSAAAFSVREGRAETPEGPQQVQPRSDPVLDKQDAGELELLLILHRSSLHPGAVAIHGHCGGSPVECADLPEQPHAHG